MPALPTKTIKAICDKGWTQWGTSCYKLETTTVNTLPINKHQAIAKLIIFFRKPGTTPTTTACAQSQQISWISSPKQRMASFRPSPEAPQQYGRVGWVILIIYC